jgi:hypothetical protein
MVSDRIKEQNTMDKRRLSLIALVLSLALTGVVSANGYNMAWWTGNSGGLWSDGANWEFFFPPDIGDITHVGKYTDDVATIASPGAKTAYLWLAYIHDGTINMTGSGDLEVANTGNITMGTPTGSGYGVGAMTGTINMHGTSRVYGLSVLQCGSDGNGALNMDGNASILVGWSFQVGANSGAGLARVTLHDSAWIRFGELLINPNDGKYGFVSNPNNGIDIRDTAALRWTGNWVGNAALTGFVTKGQITGNGQVGKVEMAYNVVQDYTEITAYCAAAVTQTDGATVVVEGGAQDTFLLKLKTQPAVGDTVTVTLTPTTTDNPNANGNDISLNAAAANTPITLTFTSANWSTNQTVTVTAVNDALVEGTEYVPIRIQVSSALSNPDFQNARLLYVTAVDNDSPAVLMSKYGLSVVEGGVSSDSYTVRLATLPSANVTVAITDASTPAQLSFDQATLTFTTATWSTPQTVVVTAPNDQTAQPNPHFVTIGHTVTQTGGSQEYNGIAVVNPLVNVADINCGAGPFDVADLNQDCIVNLVDFGILASQWLNCSVASCN